MLIQGTLGTRSSTLSELIINHGGCVFGACYSHDFKSVEFTCIDRLEDLYRIKGSKYTVLFTGLGCDVGALRAFVRANKINDANLFTIDLICMGATLQGVHESYIESLEKKYKSRIKNFSLRCNLYGWTPYVIMAEFENSRKFYKIFNDSDYGRAFRLYSRSVCCQCRFRGTNHQSDITIGDYWGLKPEMKGYNPDGVSVLIIHNKKGYELVKKLDVNNFVLMPADVKFIIEHNKSYYRTRGKPSEL